MIINTAQLSVYRLFGFVCLGAVILSACNSREKTCKVPSHWLSKDQPDPDLTPSSLVTVNNSGDLQLNHRAISMESLGKILKKVSKFDRSELIEVRISAQLPCDKSETVVNLVDKTAGCNRSTYCRLKISN